MPWLMLPLSKSRLQSHRSRYDISTDKTYHLELLEACFPELRIDSSNGWLVEEDSSSSTTPLPSFSSILSPESSSISLRSPPSPTLRVSTTPNQEDNFMAVAIINMTGGLAYCKNGHRSLTFMGHLGLSFYDVTYYKDKFYAVDQCGSMAACDVIGESPSVSKIVLRGLQDELEPAAVG
ncbi:putative F-box protein At5g55150 [Corylus avellana]|uniref:putative F-box protein At5g55150 n=1 Tax=Corylus avellana TaxID=13451 RepID=UPI00286A52C3|nr:putative F-box protein At5g55150 [Corylus avellana]